MNAAYPSGRPSFSHTALEYYMKCGEFYRKWYLDRTVPRPVGRGIDLMVGAVVHTVLENYYKQAQKSSALAHLERYWRAYFEQFKLTAVYALIREWFTDHENLKLRATKDYIGEDAIRSKDGKVARSPQMTSAWGAASAALNLDQRKRIIDVAVGKQDSDYADTSVVEVFCGTFTCLRDYEHPSAIVQIDAIETNLANVRYPRTGKAVTGKIDLICRTAENDLMIVDHKTSQHAHQEAYKVGYSEQLLLYGWAYFQMHGKVPEYIGINFIRKNWFVASPFDMELAQECVQRRETAIQGILRGVFIARNPTDFGSPCYGEYSKYKCPYLAVCHPKFYSHVRDESR